MEEQLEYDKLAETLKAYRGHPFGDFVDIFPLDSRVLCG